MSINGWNQRGVSLLEVLIAVVVFAVGLLAIAALQGELVRSAGDAKARTVAANLAEQQMEQFRSFTLAAGVSFDDIVDRPEGSALVNAVSGVEYRQWWEVDDYHFPADTGTAVLGMTPSGRSDFKMIRVHVDWTDESGVNREVMVEDIIANSPPSDALLAVIGSAPPEHPIIRYKDVLVAPEVIEINLGDETVRQTSKPRPEVESAGQNILTSFDAITFSTTLVDSFPVLARREEFVSINCRCEQAGDGAGRTPAVWENFQQGSQQRMQWRSGRDVEKRVGAPLSGLDQPFLCDRCCRDHHDVDGEDSFDPFRPAGNDANGNPFFPSGLNGDHGHFNFDSTTGELVPADSPGQEYLEACTFTRIGGVFEVTSDFKLESILVLPIEYLQTPAGISHFQDFVTTFVEEYVDLIGDDYPKTTPNLNLNATPNDASGTLQSLWDSFPQEIPPPANGSVDGQRLLARGIYVNFMTDELRSQIPSEGGAVLPFVPFQEINLTRLATWDDGASSSIFVTNDALTAGNQDVYDRGRAIHCASYTPTDGSGTVEPRCDITNATVTATIFTGNTGLLANANPTDTDDAVVRTDDIMIDFDLEPPPPSRSVVGQFSLHPSVKGVEMSNLTVASSAGVFCTRPSPTEYTCIFEDATADGTITIGNYNATDRNGNVINHMVCPEGVVFDDGTTTVTNLGPVNDGLANETTTFDLVAMPDDEFVLDIAIKKNGC